MEDFCYIPTFEDLRGHPRIKAVYKDVLNRYGYSVEDIELMNDDQLDAFRHGLGRNIGMRLSHEKQLIINSIKNDLAGFSKQLLNDYLQTDYIVNDRGQQFVINIGKKSETLLELYKFNKLATCTFITAYNPGGQLATEKANQEYQRQLTSYLDSRETLYFNGEGKGRDNQWPAEPSLCVLGLTCGEAIGLAIQFGQLAIVWASENAIPKIILTGGVEGQDLHLLEEFV